MEEIQISPSKRKIYNLLDVSSLKNINQSEVCEYVSMNPNIHGFQILLNGVKTIILQECLFKFRLIDDHKVKGVSQMLISDFLRMRVTSGTN